MEEIIRKIVIYIGIAVLAFYFWLMLETISIKEILDF